MRKSDTGSWADSAERLALADGRLRDARATFSKLSPPDALRIAQDLVDTRRAEWVAAYPSLVAVTCGYRSRRRGDREAHVLVREPCVIFVVRRKWPRNASPRRAGALPKHVLSYAQSAAGPVLVAVPTDVVAAVHAADAAAEGALDGLFADTPRYYENGNSCCVVALSHENGRLDGFYLLGCRHVFDPDGDRLGSTPAGGADVRLGRGLDADTGDPLVGTSTTYGGVIRSAASGLSVDVQLARMDHRPAFIDAFKQAVALRGAFLSRDDFIAAERRFDCQVLVPPVAIDDQAHAHRSLHPGLVRPQVWGRFLRYRHADQPIDYRTLGIQVSHQELMELKISRPKRTPNGVWATYPGDSGSPVVMETGQGRWLVGMHIAGGGEHDDSSNPRRSIILPAWVLLDRYNYPDLLSQRLTIEPVFLA